MKNCIPGVVRFSLIWLIPKDAKKPEDGRMKAKTNRRTTMEFNENYSALGLGKA